MKIEKRYSRRVLRKIVAFIIRVLFSIRKTLRYKNPISYHTPCVIAVFHGEMMPVLDLFKDFQPVFIASNNHMGFALSLVLISWGYKIVYRTRTNGKVVLEQLLEELKRGRNVIITPDGSRGPRHIMKAGAVALAKKAGVPLYLVHPDYRGIRMKFSWDHFLYPYPFAKVTFRCRKIEIDPNLNYIETEQKIKECETILNDLSEKQPPPILPPVQFV